MEQTWSEVGRADVSGLYYALIGVNVAHMLASSTVFLRRRSVFPLSGRDPILVFPGVFVVNVSIGVIAPIAGLADAAICHTLTIAIYLVGISSLNFFVARAIRAWFQYNIAEKHVENLAPGRSQSVETSLAWFLRYRKWFQPRALLVGALGVSMVEAGLLLFIARTTGCVPTFIAILLLACIKFGVVAYAGYKLRNVREGLWIKAELKWLAIAGTVGSCITGIPDFSLQSIPSYHPAIHHTLRTAVIQLFIFIVLDYPIYLSFQNRHSESMSVSEGQEKRDETHTFTKLPRLPEILHDPKHDELLSSLKQFLVGEFSVECLLYYFAVNDFHEFTSKMIAEDGGGSSEEVNRRIAERIMEVYCKYLDHKAPLQVNISYRTSAAVELRLKEAIRNFHDVVGTYRNVKGGGQSLSVIPTAQPQLARATDVVVTIFDASQGEVLRLLERDPFVRWKKAVRQNIQQAGDLLA